MSRFTLKRIFPSFRSLNNKKKENNNKKKDDEKLVSYDDVDDDNTSNQMTLEPSSPITTITTTTTTTTTTATASSSNNKEPIIEKKKKEKKCVRFPSVVKLENTRQISRLSSRSLDEVKAMWADEEEEKQRKANLKKDLKKHLCGCLQEVSEEGEENDQEEATGKLQQDDNNNKDGGISNKTPSSKLDEKKKKFIMKNDSSCSDILNDSSNSQFTALGLEDKVGIGLEIKKQHRENAWDAVMWEQYYQYEEGKSKPDYDVVANVYKEQAKTTQLQSKAQQDAQKLYEDLLKDLEDDPEVAELMSLASTSTHSRTS